MNSKYDSYNSFLGHNNKSILIIVCQKNSEVIEENNFFLLKKILNSGILSLDDVIITNTEQKDFSLQRIYQYIKPKFVISFGKLNSAETLEFYKPTLIASTTWAISHNFEELHADKSKKLKLWTALKSLECYIS